MQPAPSLFLSHGAPTLALEEAPARRFMTALGRELVPPQGFIVVSAHWEDEVAAVGAAARPATIHDFGGFPKALYDLRYPAPGSPELAAEIGTALEAAGIRSRLDPERGLDHGAWVPLLLLRPEADLPVVQVAVAPTRGPAWHLALGRALRPFRARGMMVLGSGSLTHNLMEARLRAPAGESADWVEAFAGWVDTALAEGRIQDLLDYRRLAPAAVRNHPTEEHFLPLFAAMGAGDAGAPVRHLHSSRAYGTLAMDAYAFG